MRRMLTLALVAAGAIPVAVLTLPTALAGANGTHARLALRHTRVGTILVNGHGYTLYAFSRDSRDKDTCRNISQCLTVWPPLTTGGRPLAGRGVQNGLIGTIKLANGAKQVTYAGHPLYTYLGDTSPGETSYVNLYQFHGYWPAVDAAGHEVK